MKKHTLFVAFAAIVISLLIPLNGANHVVQVGEKIQSKVAGASSGDAVIVRGGTFPEQDVTITQPMRLVREKGQNVIIGGKITLSGVSGDIVLRDFAIDVNGNGKLIIQNCSKVGLEDLTQLPQGIEISNSTVVMRSCQLGNLTITGNSDVQVIDSTLANLTTTGSKVQVVDSTMAVLTSTNTNLTLSKSTHTTGAITGGQTLYHGSTANSNVTINASDWRAHGSTFKGNLSSTNAHSKLLKTTVEKAFSHQGATKDCVVFQSTIGHVSGDILSSDANRTWVSYSTFHHAAQTGGTEAHFTRNFVRTNKAHGNRGILINGANCEATITNNHFYNGATTSTGVVTLQDTSEKSKDYNWGLMKLFTMPCPQIVQKVTNSLRNNHSRYSAYCKVRWRYEDGSTKDSPQAEQYGSSWGAKTYNNPEFGKKVTKIEVHLRASTSGTRAFVKDDKVYSVGAGISFQQGKKLIVYNNLFRNWNAYGYCVSLVASPSLSGEIRGNAFWRQSGTWRTHAVNGPEGTICSNNFFHSANHTVTGTIANYDNIVGGDPKFNTTTWALGAGSVLLNKGPEEPQFNDHDGSRNDIGLKGGHAYDPTGTTSVNPVVLSGTQNIVRMNVGDTTPIVIKARAAVSTPNQ